MSALTSFKGIYHKAQAKGRRLRASYPHLVANLDTKIKTRERALNAHKARVATADTRRAHFVASHLHHAEHLTNEMNKTNLNIVNARQEVQGELKQQGRLLDRAYQAEIATYSKYNPVDFFRQIKSYSKYKWAKTKTIAAHITGTGTAAKRRTYQTRYDALEKTRDAHMASGKTYHKNYETGKKRSEAAAHAAAPTRTRALATFISQILKI